MVATASIPYWSAAPCRVQSLDTSGGVLGVLQPFTVLNIRLDDLKWAPAGFPRSVLDSVHQADDFLICEADFNHDTIKILST